ncbi:MAG: glycosyltransferase [Candidatus Bathyarchaeota archaeon]|nr:glycosyltransferase [Candidatus Bathyarchaeota archaeon]
MDKNNDQYINNINQVNEYPLYKSNKKPVIFACIPALDEEMSIGKIILQAQKYVDLVIVCDDGSVDYTAEIAEALGAYVIRHERNEGKGAALRDMFTFALKLNANVVITLDADGQHNPVYIPNLVEPILKGEADMVVGSRYVKGGKSDAPLYRRFGLFLLNRNLGGSIKDVQSGLRAFTREALEIFIQGKSDDFGVELEQVSLAHKYNLKVKEIPVEIRYSGIYKASKKNPIIQGSEIIGTILRLTIEEHPLLYLGTLSCIVFTIGAISTILQFMGIFQDSRYSGINMLLSLIFFPTGIFLGATALILHTLSNIRRKLYKR